MNMRACLLGAFIPMLFVSSAVAQTKPLTDKELRSSIKKVKELEEKYALLYALLAKVKKLDESQDLLYRQHFFTPLSCEHIPGNCKPPSEPLVSVTEMCEPGKFLLTHGTFNGVSEAVIHNIYLKQREASEDPTERGHVASGVTYTFKVGTPNASGQLCVDVVCCSLKDGPIDVE